MLLLLLPGAGQSDSLTGTRQALHLQELDEGSQERTIACFSSSAAVINPTCPTGFFL